MPHRPKAGDNDTPAQDPTLLAKPSMNGQPQSPQAITIQPETDQPPPPTNVQADQPAATSAESKIPVQVQGPTKPQGPMASESTVHMHPSADNASDDQHDLPDDGNSDDSQPQRFASPRSIPIRTLPDSRHDEPSPPQANLAPDRKSDSGANAASPSPSATVQMKAGREEPHRGTDAAPSAPNDNKADPVADRPAAQPTLKLVPTFEPVAPSIGAAKAQLSPTQSANPASPQADPASAAVARGLTAAISQKGGSLTIRLIPETLGLVRVHMEIASGRVTATLEATSAPAHELLNSNLGMLRSALESRGLSVDRLQVNLAAAPVQNENPTSFTASHDRDGGTSSFQHDAADGHSRGGEGGGHDRQFAGGQSGTSDSEWNNQEPDPRSFGARLRLTLDAVA
ncbi:MAG TPA: flagellar hook-length control protein FliK [Phycisphaerales bacterium]|nr:flagellar hook-length control protein FliK [Phycisphaerales bacterium]